MSTDQTTYASDSADRRELQLADTATTDLDAWTRELLTTPETAVRELLGAEAAALLGRSVPMWSLLEATAELRLRPRTQRRVAAFKVLLERLAREPRPRAAAFRGPQDIARHLSHLATLPCEQFHVLVLDTKFRLVMARCLSTGGVDGVTVALPELLRFVLEVRGHGFIVAHNHPSGDPTPSEADRKLTAAITSAAVAVGLHFHDHIVIGAGRAYSFDSETYFSVHP